MTCIVSLLRFETTTRNLQNHRTNENETSKIKPTKQAKTPAKTTKVKPWTNETAKTKLCQRAKQPKKNEQAEDGMSKKMSFIIQFLHLTFKFLPFYISSGKKKCVFEKRVSYLRGKQKYENIETIGVKLKWGKINIKHHSNIHELSWQRKQIVNRNWEWRYTQEAKYTLISVVSC